jgi:hypothetical protein
MDAGRCLKPANAWEIICPALAAGSTDQCETRSAGGLAQIHSNIPDSAMLRRATNVPLG